MVARLKGGKTPADEKPAPPPKKETKAEPKHAKAAVAAKAAAKAAPPPPPEPEINPFADSVPFPESTPIEADYDGMEEVSLDQLLSEGHGRAQTFSGTIPVPIEAADDVEELAAHELMPIVDETPLAVALMDEPAPAIVASGPSDREVTLEGEVRKLTAKLDDLRDDRRNALEQILRELNDLTERVRAQLES